MAKGPNRLGEMSGPLVYPVDPKTLEGLPMPDNGLGETTRLFARGLAPMQIEGLVASARTGRVWRMASDEGAYVGGHDMGPFPPGYFLAGVVSSYMNEIEALAKTRDIAIAEIRLVLEGDFAMSGSLLRGTKTAHVRNVRLKAQIRSETSADLLNILVRDAVLFSACHDMITREREGLFTLTNNGEAVTPGRVRASEAPAPPDPAPAFAEYGPMPGDWEAIVTRFAHPAADQQGEPLFASGTQTDYADDSSLVRVFCSKRADGLKEIVQHLYNPTGTVFRFLSEEVVAGQTPRAPDAASLIAAGIGFCFLTQLGRYAQSVDMDLEAYRMIQDAPFSPGGASSGSEKAGRTEPVVAHLYLDDDEDEDMARKALDMAEQTCFMHAIGKDRVPVAIRVESL